MRKSTRSAVDILIARDRQTLVWFILFLISITGFAYERSRLVAHLTAKEQFIIMDESTYYLPKSVDFTAASDLHVAQVTLAMETLFDRSPNSPDHINRLKRLFSREAVKKAHTFFAQEANLFSAKHIHQKVEIGEIKLLETTDQLVIATAHGQLIRNGVFDGEGFTEAFAITVRCQFTRNRDLLINGGFPTILVAFNIESLTPVAKP